MDLFIRNVDVVSVKKIDEMAKQKRMSRQEFLKFHIEKLAWIDVFQEERNRFEEIIQSVGVAIEKSFQMSNDLKKEVGSIKLLLMQLADMNEEEMSEFFESVSVR